MWAVTRAIDSTISVVGMLEKLKHTIAYVSKVGMLQSTTVTFLVVFVTRELF